MHLLTVSSDETTLSFLTQHPSKDRDLTQSPMTSSFDGITPRGLSLTATTYPVGAKSGPSLIMPIYSAPVTHKRVVGQGAAALLPNTLLLCR